MNTNNQDSDIHASTTESEHLIDLHSKAANNLALSTLSLAIYAGLTFFTPAIAEQRAQNTCLKEQQSSLQVHKAFNYESCVQHKKTTQINFGDQFQNIFLGLSIVFGLYAGRRYYQIARADMRDQARQDQARQTAQKPRAPHHR